MNHANSYKETLQQSNIARHANQVPPLTIRLQLALAAAVESRLECKQLETKLKSLQVQIEKDAVPVSESVEKDLLTIMGEMSL